MDLNDLQLKGLLDEDTEEFPLISCLNGSSWWEYQCFAIDFKEKKVNLLDAVDAFHECQDEEDKLPLVFPERAMKLVPLDDSEKPVNSTCIYSGRVII